MPPKQPPQGRPKSSLPYNRTNTEPNSSTSIEIQSLKDIIAALNQKLVKTIDLDIELTELRSLMVQSNDGRAQLRDQLAHLTE